MAWYPGGVWASANILSVWLCSLWNDWNVSPRVDTWSTFKPAVLTVSVTLPQTGMKKSISYVQMHLVLTDNSCPTKIYWIKIIVKMSLLVVYFEFKVYVSKCKESVCLVLCAVCICENDLDIYFLLSCILNSMFFNPILIFEFLTNLSTCCHHLNSLWPSDAIWRHRSGSTLAQVMACCLKAPSHYLNQCWLIISMV